eukprot:5292799-Ditylum_brightwellii.AAC.1
MVTKNDSPEFHDAKHLSKGNGTYTAVRGWLLDINQSWNRMHSCAACCNAMLLHPIDLTKREFYEGASWSIEDDLHKVLRFHPPTFYPTTSSNINKNGKLEAQQISNDHLCHVLDAAHNNITSEQ